MDLIPHLVKSRKLKETSINNYVRNIRTLHGKKPFDNVKWLTDTDAILEKIKDYSIKTKRNMITSVIVVLKAIDEKEFEAALTKYKSMLLDMNKEINTEYSTHSKTEKEKKNWLTLDELKSIQQEYEQQVKDRNIKDKTKLNAKDNKLLQSYMVSSLYTLQAPVRLDYAGMLMVGSRKEIKEKENYLVVIGSRKKYFVFQNFKNVDKMGAIEQQVGKELNKVINLYLRFNDTDDFLLNARGHPMSANSLSKLLPRVFNKAGKSVNLNMIRKSWVKDVVNPEQVKKEKDLAQAMHHTEATQKEVYLKTD